MRWRSSCVSCGSAALPQQLELDKAVWKVSERAADGRPERFSLGFSETLPKSGYAFFKPRNCWRNLSLSHPLPASLFRWAQILSRFRRRHRAVRTAYDRSLLLDEMLEFLQEHRDALSLRENDDVLAQIESTIARLLRIQFHAGCL